MGVVIEIIKKDIRHNKCLDFKWHLNLRRIFVRCKSTDLPLLLAQLHAESGILGLQCDQTFSQPLDLRYKGILWYHVRTCSYAWSWSYWNITKRSYSFISNNIYNYCCRCYQNIQTVKFYLSAFGCEICIVVSYIIKRLNFAT